MSLTGAPDSFNAARSRLAVMAEELDQSGMYRVLRKFIASEEYGKADRAKCKVVAFVDVETTGLTESDRAIEIGIVCVEVDFDNGAAGRVVGRYSGFEDPGFRIPEHITALTGISEDDVKGSVFDDAAVESIAGQANLVIAHNAAFDRPMLEKRFRIFKSLRWACSMEDVPWLELGFLGKKQEVIALGLQRYYTSHRALNGCEALAAIMCCGMGANSGYLNFCIETSSRCIRRIWAINAPIQMRDELRANGFKWGDGVSTEVKAWYIDTTDPAEYLSWLRSRIYKKPQSVIVETSDASMRFTKRFRSRVSVCI